MIRVRFLRADGTLAVEAKVAPGARLLDVAQAAGQPLEGTCGGELACATCHLILDTASFAALPLPTPEEEDMLDFAEGARATSRLSCQVWLPGSLETLEARLP